MPAEPGSEPVAPDELLYRRVPMIWYSPESGLSPQAFDPHKTNDTTGLSISRAKYKSIEHAALGQPGKSYYVAVLRAADLFQHSIQIVPRPILPADPGHAELPDLTAHNRKSPVAQERMVLLKRLCLRVEGPFPALSI